MKLRNITVRVCRVEVHIFHQCRGGTYELRSENAVIYCWGIRDEAGDSMLHTSTCRTEKYQRDKQAEMIFRSAD